jgi:hypothetical protein
VFAWLRRRRSIPADVAAAYVCSVALAAVVDNAHRHPEVADAARPIMLAVARKLVAQLQGEPPAATRGNVIRFERRR